MEVHAVVTREEVEMWDISTVLEKLAQLINVGLGGKRWLLHIKSETQRETQIYSEGGRRERNKEYPSDVGFCLMLYIRGTHDML